MFLATKKFQTQQRRAVDPGFVTNLWEAAASDREVVLSRSPACCVLTAALSGFTWVNKDSGQSRSLSVFFYDGLFIYLLSVVALPFRAEVDGSP